MDLVKLLNDHKATALASQASLGGADDFFAGYVLAIGHAIELAKIQQIRLDLGLAGSEHDEELRREDETAHEPDEFSAQAQDIERNR